MIAKRRIAGILLAGAVSAGGVSALSRADQAEAQTGIEEVGVAVAVAAELVNHAKEAVQSYGDAILFVKAATGGPDADDRSEAYDVDRDRGLDWDLTAEARAYNTNAGDDGQETPYTRGSAHVARLSLGYEADIEPFSFLTWTPKIIPGTRPQREYDGFAVANVEDDPVAGASPVETSAGAAGAFAADGTASAFCFSAAASGAVRAIGDVQPANCSPKRRWSLRFGVMLLAAPGRFSYTETAGGVRVEPLFEREIDLVHTYMQRRGDNVILPLEKGSSDLLDVRERMYALRAKGKRRLVRRASKRADLTLIGARVKLEPRVVAKGTRPEMLRRYFEQGVGVVAPSHAQHGYKPKVVAAGVVTGGEDVSKLAGRRYELPDFRVTGIGETPKDASEQAIGVFIAVKGSMTEAVRLAVRTRGSYIRRGLTAAARRRRARASQSTIKFKLPGMTFHHEAGLFMDDVDSASAQTTRHELSVAHSGDGTGTITSDPAGISCPGDCTESYPAGTTVTLVPSPAADSAFDGWSGACTGTGGCAVAMDAAKQVTAHYRSIRYSLDVTLSGSGTGQVTSQPAGIACPGDCTESYTGGTTVTLTATPSGGSEFVQWAGDCTGFSPTCEVTMNQARTVTAEFAGPGAAGLARLSTLRPPAIR